MGENAPYKALPYKALALRNCALRRVPTLGALETNHRDRFPVWYDVRAPDSKRSKRPINQSI